MNTNLLRLACALYLSSSACGVDTLPVGQNPGADASGGGGGGGGGGGDGDSDADPGGEVVDSRVKDGLQLLYRFDGVAGQTTVSDVSGVGDPFDLTIVAPESVTWDGGGMTFVAPTVAQNITPIAKVFEACKASNEITLEAWVKNSTVTDANGRIVSSSIDAGTRNFQLKQANDSWGGRVRTTGDPLNKEDPSLLGSATIDEQHVLWTRDSIGVSDFYVNGVKQSPAILEGNYGNWDLTYGLTVGNEPTLDRPWLGTVYLVAVYCTGFDPADVAVNYAAGH